MIATEPEVPFWVGVVLFDRLTDAIIKNKSLKYSHLEIMADKGLLPASENYREIRPRLEAPWPVEGGYG